MTQKTALTELIEEMKETLKTALPEFQTGIQHAILRASCYLPKERQDLIDFHIEITKIGLMDEGEIKWSDSYEPLVRLRAEQYVHEKFGI